MALNLTKVNQLNFDSLTKILQEHFNDSSVRISDLEGNQNFLKENDNFNSEVKKWTFKITKGIEGEETLETLSLIVKSSPLIFFQRKLNTIARLFTREIFWFRYAYPTLINICPEISDISPVCFYGNSNYLGSLFGRKRFMEKICCVPCFPITLPNEEGLIIMEDLCTRKTPLELMKKTEILTFLQAKTVFEALARFHGVWLKWHYLAQKGEADHFGPLRLNHYEEMGFEIKPWMLKGFLLDHMGELVGMVLKGQNVDESIRQRWKHYTETKLKAELIQVWQFCESKGSPISTVCHGDVWSNNLLFSQDREQVVFIDYQLMSISHPAKDLWYLLTANTNREFRRQYLDELLKIYFDVFKSFLDDVNIKMTFSEFSKEFYDRRHYSFMTGFLILQNILSPDKIELKGINPWKKLYEVQKERLGGVPTPDDHPLIIENRCRFVEFVEEAAECSFI